MTTAIPRPWPPYAPPPPRATSGRTVTFRVDFGKLPCDWTDVESSAPGRWQIHASPADPEGCFRVRRVST